MQIGSVPVGTVLSGFGVLGGLLWIARWAVGGDALLWAGAALLTVLAAGAGAGTDAIDDGALASFALTMGTGPTIVQPLTASAAAVRKDGIQARVRLDAMLQAFQGGAQGVDLTGGNSRAGAEDLHRYGGEARMYFRVDVAPAPGTGDTVSAGHDERSGRDE